MKPSILLLNLCMWLCTTTFAQSWEVIYRGELSSGPNILSMPDSIHGWYLERFNGNNAGVIKKTEDGGDTWTTILEEVWPERLRYVYAYDSMHVWVSFSGGGVIRSIDGGQTWSVSSQDSQRNVQKIQFITPLKGWMLKRKFLYFPGDGPNIVSELLTTSDGGQTWAMLLEGQNYSFVDTNSGATISYVEMLDFRFLNDSVGFIATRGHSLNNFWIHKTENGGVDWRANLLFDVISPGETISPVSDSMILVSDHDYFRFAETRDAGASWEVAPNLDIFGDTLLFNVTYFKFKDSSGFATGRYRDIQTNLNFGDGIYFSPDSGQTWLPQYVNRGIDFFPFVHNVINSRLAYATTRAGNAILRYRGAPAPCGGELLVPSPGSTAADLLPLLSWQRVRGCVDGYRLQLSLQPNLGDPFLDTQVLLDTVYQVLDALPADTVIYCGLLPFNHQFGPAPDGCNPVFSFRTPACPPPTWRDTVLCAGESLWLADSLIAAPGEYVFAYPVAGLLGCDSVVTWRVQPGQPIVTGLIAPLCVGDTLRVLDTLITQAGVYERLYQRSNGCDSLVRLQVVARALSYTAIDTTLAFGQPWLDGFVYAGDTTLVYTLVAANGCDSIVTVQLRIITSTSTQEGANVTPPVWRWYPNPTSERLWLAGPAQAASIQLLDALGRPVWYSRWSAADAPQREYPLPNLPPGVYWIRIDTNHHRQIGRLAVW